MEAHILEQYIRIPDETKEFPLQQNDCTAQKYNLCKSVSGHTNKRLQTDRNHSGPVNSDGHMEIKSQCY